MKKYTDGKSIYYVSGLLGDNQYAVCKKAIGSKSLGNHRYRARTNKVVSVVSTADEAQKYLNQLAQKKEWNEFEETV